MIKDVKNSVRQILLEWGECISHKTDALLELLVKGHEIKGMVVWLIMLFISKIWFRDTKKARIIYCSLKVIQVKWIYYYLDLTPDYSVV